ncbi:hypothetical protein [Mycobacterium noviomagense]|uniref:Alcohol dehydrogenase n=1 Tax=Mycobacterium noviomagense TaxID=459858 RepID=A0A7I7PD51_9MYCO|nr:hypothetical protein [Mycobacterium noviomagense]ORB16572.1 hypothetical protein BST37_06660 [Mycobacterium noviomagense]BBY06456.1 hypothetical protein MNVI_17740 [Mycobacterium noviomagense]
MWAGVLSLGNTLTTWGALFTTRMVMRMRAVVLRDGQLHVGETADPVPGQGETVLRTLSTAICASDVHVTGHPHPNGDIS